MKNKIKKSISSSLLTILVSSPLLADDLEIYTGAGSNDTSVNILFMLDTSGSMSSTVSGTNESRMQQAKNALKEVVGSLPDDMKVGLGRFNDPAGSILTPVRRLGDDITVDITKKPIRNTDDAYERTGKTYETFTTTDQLYFETSGTTVTARIDNEYYDAEECLNGTDTVITAQYADINYDGSGCFESNAFIFRNLDIPKGSKILSATMELTTYNGFNNVSTNLYVENNVNPNAFDYYQANISNRTYFSNSLLWNFSETTRYEKNYSPDLKSFVQTLVSNSNWDQTNNGITIKLDSTTDKWLRNTYYTSYSTTTSYRPLLSVTYRTNEDDNLVGIKFSDIQAGSGSTISKGRLKLTASANNYSGNLYIKTEAGKDPETFADSLSNISSRTSDSTELVLPYSNWKAGEVRYFDVSPLIQNKVNDSNWCGGSSINFIIKSDRANAVYSYDHSTEYSPELTLAYSGGDENSCVSSSSINQISSQSDDSHESNNKRQKNYPYNNTVLTSSGGLSGFIFRTKDIPSTAKIKEAYIQLTAHGNTSYYSSFQFLTYLKKPISYPIDSFQNKNSHISNRFNNLIGGKTWNISSGVYTNNVFVSPDISEEITSIINSSSYINASPADRGFEVYLQGLSGDFHAFSYDENPGKSAKLIIKFEATTGAVRSLNGDNSNSNISNLSTSTTGSPMTVRQHLLELIDDQPYRGNTPMEGSLYEAGLYYLGEPVNYGRSRNSSQTSSGTVNSQRISGKDTYTGGEIVYPSGCSSDNLDSSYCKDIYISGNPIYTSPMTDKVCETNNIILITDGYPTSYYSYTSNIRDYFGVPLSTLIYNKTGKYCTDSWSCAKTWVSYLYNNDFMPDKAGKSNVVTHIISFNELDSEGKLRDLAKSGGGVFITSNNTAELVNALNMVISNIMDIETTLATPGVAVNQNKRTEHLSDIYYSVFQPTIAKYWYGNLKKYRLSTKTGNIVDQYGENAVDETTGFFKEDTTSFWSTTSDGGEVRKGGSASLQNITNRKVLTYTSNTPANESKLDQEINVISENNSALTPEMFGVTSSELPSSDFNSFLQWLRGVDIFDDNFNGSTTDARKLMGDPLHSRPILVSYSDNENIVFVSTNEGFLHAIDASTGEEKFAFLPKELLPNSYQIYLGGSGNHIYGLDSSWVAWRHDENKDGVITKSDGDFVYLYSGMRRGGNYMYALDVTEPSNPKLKYVLSPDTGSSFENLGQTWSEPVLAKIKIAGQEKIVLIFGGGYDLAYDNEDYNNLIDSYGNYLYIIDADTGSLLWSASGTGSGATLEIPSMNYSIVSKPTLLDIDGNGFTDIIYVTDTSSQIIKFNIDNENTSANNLSTGKIIAKLGKSTGNNNIENTRMMYDALAAAPIRNNGEKYIALVAGTGYRSHPLDIKKQDAIFVLKDKEDYYTNNPEYITTPILMSDLANLTDDLSEAVITDKLKDKKGYYIWLRESDTNFIGEKMTGEPLIYDNQIYLNTYVPNESKSECTPVVGYVRGYRMNVNTSLPLKDQNGDGNISTEDRYVDNLTSGIANGSKIIYTEEGVFLLTNTKVEKIGNGGTLGTNKKRWYQQKQ